MPLLSLDCESTGLAIESDRIVTIAIGRSTGPGDWNPIEDSLINPGVPIPAEATKVHGITDEDAAKGSPPRDGTEHLLAADPDGGVGMTRDELLAPGAGLELLLDIRLDGIATGYATAMLMIADASGMSQDEAERYADDETDRALLAIKRDPLAMEEQRREVRERLAGVDSGPRTVRTIDGGDPA